MRLTRTRASSTRALPPTGRPVSRRLRPVHLAAVAAMLVVALAWEAAPAVAATPVLTAPASAAPGQTITVTGTYFAAAQVGMITFNGGKIGTFTASSAGSFSVSVVIPSTATVGSTGRISAKDNAANLLATTTLLIVSSTVGVNPTPTPTATPTAAPTTTPSPTATPTASAPSSSIPNFAHVYIIIFENKEYSSIVGSSSAPYINSLIPKYGLSTAFYAERHPSEPNYIALTSGSTQGITDDGVYNLSARNVFDQIEASGRTWHAYMQGYPGNCFTGSSSSAVVDGPGKSGSYVRKHDPAISYTAISGNSTRCAKITKLSGFDPAAANFEFITPNMINDMHDGTIADGDNFLKAFLPTILNSAAFTTTNSVVYLTFDEGTTNTNGGGHIFTMALTHTMTPGYKSTNTQPHYSMLRTIETAWGMPFLGNAASASLMSYPY